MMNTTKDFTGYETLAEDLLFARYPGDAPDPLDEPELHREWVQDLARVLGEVIDQALAAWMKERRGR